MDKDCTLQLSHLLDRPFYSLTSPPPLLTFLLSPTSSLSLSFFFLPPPSLLGHSQKKLGVVKGPKGRGQAVVVFSPVLFVNSFIQIGRFVDRSLVENGKEKKREVGG